MAPTIEGTRATSPLGEAQFYRLTFAPAFLMAWAFADKLAQLRDTISSTTGLVFGVNEPVILGDVGSFDVKTQTGQGTRTVADLVAAVQRQLGNYLVLTTVAKRSRDTTVGARAETSRGDDLDDAAATKKAKDGDGFLDDIEDVLMWLVILCAVLAVIYAAWTLSPFLPRRGGGRR